MKDGEILLVEDNESDIELTRRALKKSRIANPLVIARNGPEACDFMFCAGVWSQRDISKLPALILLDLKLPIFGGLEVLRRIRADERTRRAIVVMLTSSDEPPDISTAYHFGVNSYLCKPVEFDKFSEIIQKLGMYWLLTNIGPLP